MGADETLGEYLLSTDPARLDIDAIHAYLTLSYWAAGIPREVVARSIAHSLNFGVYHAGRQVAFARVVTDYATFAWLGDVFVLEAHRGRGISKWLMERVMAHPDLRGLRRWMLCTRDAHALYARYGWTPPKNAAIYMEIHRPQVYADVRAAGGAESTDAPRADA